MTALATLDLPGGAVLLRTATVDDLAGIVALLVDDQLGAGREDPHGDLGPYRDAFAAIDADPAHLLVVAEDGSRPTDSAGSDPSSGGLLGTLQLSFLPGLARSGAWRAQVEAVRVSGAARGRGLGTAMIEWTMAEATRRGCALIQLTTDKQRTDAHRFYARLGFVASHEGMKRPLP